jgi:hypothetical protein
MTLFLIFSSPLLFMLVALLPWEAGHYVRKLHLFSVFFKGLICFIPAYIICLIVNAVVGSPLTGFALYVSIFVKDDLTPLLLGIGFFILVQRRLGFPANPEGIFLVVFSFLSGYYALYGVIDWLSRFGQWEAGDLFISPLLRMTAIMAVSVGSLRFYGWEGRSAAAFFGCAAGLCAVLALIGWLYGVSFPWLSAALSFSVFVASVVFFILQFPRVLRAKAGS